MIKCPGCGASMRFDPATQMLKCDFCSGSYAITDQTTADNVSEETEYFESTLFTCPNCNGEIMADGDTAVTFCSYCGSSVELQGRLVKMIPPSYVLPFKTTKESVEEQYKKYIGKALFAPKYMREQSNTEKIRGIYMPYWLYDYSANQVVGLSGQKSHRSGDYIITDHYRINVPLKAEYKGTAFDASSSFSDELSESIAPYNVRDNKPFQEAYMAGFYADTADVQAVVYEPQAREAVGQDATVRVIRSRKELSGYNVSTSDGSIGRALNADKQEMAYFPVWFLATKHGDHVSYAVVNGQTGKVAADVPIAFGKYLIGSLILALPIWLILNFGVTPTPRAVAFIGIIFAIISYNIASRELNLIYTREKFFDDKGILSVDKDARNTRVAAEIEQNGINTTTQKKPSGAGMMILLTMACAFGGMFITVVGAAIESGFLQFVGMALFMGCGFLPALIGKQQSSQNTMQENKKAIVKQPFKQKLNILWKSLVAILAAIILIIINPFQDIIYYAGALVIMALVIASFMDVITLHNKLTKRVPRQFAKRGGDE